MVNHPIGTLQPSYRPPGSREESTCLPFSRPGISTERREGGMSLVARTQSSNFFNFLYSTRKDWMGNPPFPRGIQVTYTDVSEAMEMVGRSGASGAARDPEGHPDMKHSSHPVWRILWLSGMQVKDYLHCTQPHALQLLNALH